ncbi:hypothetical protein [Klebsiella aerogenes]|uniref:hypothetical protein n=1 Tax=Klebsiella aerogenes TaxID=548 RepID=UPI0005EFE07E|nr:hypothetical protein [Klebsiella aerogenes]ELA0086653.1 type III secretion system protein [Klebsiella aerogenes]ELA0209145.1 type III secretion system protein [Klebsiella aerogenes]ELA0225267.1 type III secretion system protein [Klebsiella aerogenes]ELA0230249.1 type III secretion system protein [Klebsiella aerogenes]KJO55864.1 type III secretion system protein [Klebsiella aerogenes]
MEAWRKGREFVRMLDRKQHFLQGDIVKTESRLAQVRLQIMSHQQEVTDINQQIKMLTPAGVVSREDIYKGIRQQGALLTHQNIVFHKISQLENEQYNLENTLEEQRAALSVLDKKHYKITYYLQPLRRDYLRRCDDAAENEIQEIAGYGRKNI